MDAAIALPTGSNIAQPARAEVLARYRHLREISKAHHTKAFDFLSPAALMQQARRLGLADGRKLILDSSNELDLVSDLVIHTAQAGRSRAIDRYARNAPPPAGSDEALVLDAMRNARFAVLSVEARHPAVGLLLVDVIRDAEVWLVDEELEKSLPTGTWLATRHFTPDLFSMTAGVGVLVYPAVLSKALTKTPGLRGKYLVEALEDPRFAEALYRASIDEGLTERMRFQDPPAEGYAA